MTKRFLLALIIAVAVMAGPAAAPAQARTCARRCRRAVALCAAKHCPFHGAVLAGCRRGWKITLVGACKESPDGDICEQVQADRCANG